MNVFNAKNNCGFTLVELLVVIAIISILAGLLLPVLENAVSSARQVQCVANLRQMMLLTNNYAEDNNGWTYCADDYSYSWYPDNPRYWYTQMALLDYFPGECTGPSTWYYGYRSLKDPLPPLLHCPEIEESIFGYGMRGYTECYRIAAAPIALSRFAWSIAKDIPVHGTTSPFAPSNFILYGDAANLSDNEPTDQLWLTRDYRKQFHLRHLGAGCAVFADGHAASVRSNGWEDYGDDAALNYE